MIEEKSQPSPTSDLKNTSNQATGGPHPANMVPNNAIPPTNGQISGQSHSQLKSDQKATENLELPRTIQEDYPSSQSLKKSIRMAILAQFGSSETTYTKLPKTRFKVQTAGPLRLTADGELYIESQNIMKWIFESRGFQALFNLLGKMVLFEDWGLQVKPKGSTMGTRSLSQVKVSNLEVIFEVRKMTALENSSGDGSAIKEAFENIMDKIDLEELLGSVKEAQITKKQVQAPTQLPQAELQKESQEATKEAQKTTTESLESTSVTNQPTQIKIKASAKAELVKSIKDSSTTSQETNELEKPKEPVQSTTIAITENEGYEDEDQSSLGGESCNDLLNAFMMINKKFSIGLGLGEPGSEREIREEESKSSEPLKTIRQQEVVGVPQPPEPALLGKRDEAETKEAPESGQLQRIGLESAKKEEKSILMKIDEKKVQEVSQQGLGKEAIIVPYTPAKQADSSALEITSASKTAQITTITLHSSKKNSATKQPITTQLEDLERRPELLQKSQSKKLSESKQKPSTANPTNLGTFSAVKESSESIEIIEEISKPKSSSNKDIRSFFDLVKVKGDQVFKKQKIQATSDPTKNKAELIAVKPLPNPLVAKTTTTAEEDSDVAIVEKKKGLTIGDLLKSTLSAKPGEKSKPGLSSGWGSPKSDLKPKEGDADQIKGKEIEEGLISSNKDNTDVEEVEAIPADQQKVVEAGENEKEKYEIDESEWGMPSEKKKRFKTPIFVSSSASFWPDHEIDQDYDNRGREQWGEFRSNSPDEREQPAEKNQINPNQQKWVSKLSGFDQNQSKESKSVKDRVDVFKLFKKIHRGLMAPGNDNKIKRGATGSLRGPGMGPEARGRKLLSNLDPTNPITSQERFVSFSGSQEDYCEEEPKPEPKKKQLVFTILKSPMLIDIDQKNFGERNKDPMRTSKQLSYTRCYLPELKTLKKGPKEWFYNFKGHRTSSNSKRRSAEKGGWGSLSSENKGNQRRQKLKNLMKTVKEFKKNKGKRNVKSRPQGHESSQLGTEGLSSVPERFGVGLKESSTSDSGHRVVILSSSNNSARKSSPEMIEDDIVTDSTSTINLVSGVETRPHEGQNEREVIDLDTPSKSRHAQTEKEDSVSIIQSSQQDQGNSSHGDQIASQEPGFGQMVPITQNVEIRQDGGILKIFERVMTTNTTQKPKEIQEKSQGIQTIEKEGNFKLIKTYYSVVREKTSDSGTHQYVQKNTKIVDEYHEGPQSMKNSSKKINQQDEIEKRLLRAEKDPRLRSKALDSIDPKIQRQYIEGKISLKSYRKAIQRKEEEALTERYKEIRRQELLEELRSLGYAPEHSPDNRISENRATTITEDFNKNEEDLRPIVTHPNEVLLSDMFREADDEERQKEEERKQKEASEKVVEISCEDYDSVKSSEVLEEETRPITRRGSKRKPNPRSSPRTNVFKPARKSCSRFVSRAAPSSASIDSSSNSEPEFEEIQETPKMSKSKISRSPGGNKAPKKMSPPLEFEVSIQAEQLTQEEIDSNPELASLFTALVKSAKREQSRKKLAAVPDFSFQGNDETVILEETISDDEENEVSVHESTLGIEEMSVNEEPSLEVDQEHGDFENFVEEILDEDDDEVIEVKQEYTQDVGMLRNVFEESETPSNSASNKDSLEKAQRMISSYNRNIDQKKRAEPVVESLETMDAYQKVKRRDLRKREKVKPEKRAESDESLEAARAYLKKEIRRRKKVKLSDKIKILKKKKAKALRAMKKSSRAKRKKALEQKATEIAEVAEADSGENDRTFDWSGMIPVEDHKNYTHESIHAYINRLNTKKKGSDDDEGETEKPVKKVIQKKKRGAGTKAKAKKGKKAAVTKKRQKKSASATAAGGKRKGKKKTGAGKGKKKGKRAGVKTRSGATGKKD